MPLFTDIHFVLFIPSSSDLFPGRLFTQPTCGKWPFVIRATAY